MSPYGLDPIPSQTLEQYLGFTATQWTAFAAIATLITSAIAMLVAVALHRYSNRSAKDAQSVISALEAITRSDRIDSVLRQLQNEGDSRRITDLIHEGRSLAPKMGGHRLALEEAYFSNEASPWLSPQMFPDDVSADVRRSLTETFARSLPRRYASWPRGDRRHLPVDRLASLTAQCILNGASTRPIAQFVVDEISQGGGYRYGEIQQILVQSHHIEGVSERSDLAEAIDYMLCATDSQLELGHLLIVAAGASSAIIDLQSSAMASEPLHPDSLLAVRRVLWKCYFLGEEIKAVEPYLRDLSSSDAVALVAHGMGVCAAGARDRYVLAGAYSDLIKVLASFPEPEPPSIEKGIMPSWEGYAGEQLKTGVELLDALLEDSDLKAAMRGQFSRLGLEDT